eukprot:175281-Pelagomonas_calceolata.AAC.1
MDRFWDTGQGAVTATESTKVSHCGYTDDTMVLANSAENLPFQLNRFHEYARHKELTLNTNKTK